MKAEVVIVDNIFMTFATMFRLTAVGSKSNLENKVNAMYVIQQGIGLGA